MIEFNRDISMAGDENSGRRDGPGTYFDKLTCQHGRALLLRRQIPPKVEFIYCN